MKLHVAYVVFKIALRKKMAYELSVLYLSKGYNIEVLYLLTLVDSNKVVIFSHFTCFHAKWCETKLK